MKTILIILALAPCNIRWNPNPAADQVTHYRVFRGIDQVAEVTTNRATIELPADRPSTLTVIAYNASGASEPSDPYTVIPVTPHSATRLDIPPELWTKQRPFFVPGTPSHFFRFSYPTPDH